MSESDSATMELNVQDDGIVLLLHNPSLVEVEGVLVPGCLLTASGARASIAALQKALEMFES